LPPATPPAVHDNDLIRLQKAFIILQRDMAQAVPRPVRNDFGDAVGAMTLRNNILEFSRQGWPNPLQASRSELQRVRYEVNAKVSYGAWPGRNWTASAAWNPARACCWQSVEGLQIRLTSAAGQQETEWPSQNSQYSNNPDALAVMPTGVEWIMSVKPWGEIRRIFRLPDSLEVSKNGEQP
jgi:general secretion pathway protein J